MSTVLVVLACWSALAVLVLPLALGMARMNRRSDATTGAAHDAIAGGAMLPAFEAPRRERARQLVEV